MVEINVTPEVREINIEVSRALKGDTGATGATGPQGPAGADGVVQTVVGGTNITVDATDPANPIVNNDSPNANHTGDATGSTALTLATVNSNVGSFTNADITVNAKGLITAAANGSGGGGGGSELQRYWASGWVDAASTTTWHRIPYNGLRWEWGTSSGITNTSSMVTMVDSSYTASHVFGVARSAQTVDRFKLRVSQAAETTTKGISIIKATWNSGHTATTAKTVLYENNNITYTNNILDLTGVDFSTTAISENDEIHVFIYSTTTGDRYLWWELICTID